MAKHAGADADAIASAMARVGLCPTVLHDDTAHVPLHAEAQFLDTLAEVTGEDLIGARIGGAHDPRHGSIVSYILFNGCTVRELLSLCSRFLPLTRPQSRVRLEPEGGGARFVFGTSDPIIRVHAQHMEFSMASLLNGLSVACGPQARPMAIRFGTHRRKGADRLAQALRCPVTLQSEQTEVLFSNTVLDMPLRTRDEYLLDHLTTYGGLLLAQRKAQPPDLRRQIEDVVISHLALGVPPLHEISAHLGMSQRTFSRRLTQSGLNYRTILDDVRHQLAKTYLADPHLSLCEIAFMVGFGDQSSFGTAFRRWTGVSPGHYRTRPLP